jgi:hypothetical protein
MRQCEHCFTQCAARFRRGQHGEILCDACGKKQQRLLIKSQQQRLLAKLKRRRYLRDLVFEQLHDSLEELRFCLPEYLDFHIENTAELIGQLFVLDNKPLSSEESSTSSDLL